MSRERSISEKRIITDFSAGDPDKQKRLKNIILNLSDREFVRKGEYVIPIEIEDIVNKTISKTILFYLWSAPCPYLWGDEGDPRNEVLDDRRSPAIMWKDGYGDEVVDFFRVILDKLSSD